MEGPPEERWPTRRPFYSRGDLYSRRGETGGRMRKDLEDEHTVECSGRIVLVCKECWEATILLGLEEDWLSERTDFTCVCGQDLTLADRENEEALSVRRLLRGTVRPAGDAGKGD